jgi:hypothetical protein
MPNLLGLKDWNVVNREENAHDIGGHCRVQRRTDSLCPVRRRVATTEEIWRPGAAVHGHAHRPTERRSGKYGGQVIMERAVIFALASALVGLFFSRIHFHNESLELFHCFNPSIHR